MSNLLIITQTKEITKMETKFWSTAVVCFVLALVLGQNSTIGLVITKPMMKSLSSNLPCAFAKKSLLKGALTSVFMIA